MARWCIDPGHGGSDPGASNLFTTEKVINLIVALEVVRILVKNGQDVMLTRSDDRYIGLYDRAVKANNFKADYTVSIHHNAGGGDGGEAIHSIFLGEGKELADLVVEEFAAIGQNIRRVFSKELIRPRGRTDYFGIVRMTDMPTVITEFGFMDNAKDYAQFDETHELMYEALAIAKACLRMVGKELVAPDPDWRDILRETQSSPDNWIPHIESLMSDGGLNVWWPEFIKNIYNSRK